MDSTLLKHDLAQQLNGAGTDERVSEAKNADAREGVGVGAGE